MTLDDIPALILVDIQKGFQDNPYWGGKRNNPYAELQAQKLLAFWREHQLPVFHVKHNSTNPDSPLAPGSPGNEINELVTPLEGEPLIEKTVNSAFIGTNLKERLDAHGVHQVVVVGLTTDHCISTTVRMSGNFGFETYLIEDALATYGKKDAKGKEYQADLIHETALASLHEEFATVMSSEELLTMLGE